MQLQIGWNRTTNFTGRNGYMQCKGMDVLTLPGSNSVMLSPLTSRGKVGRCDIEVPIEALPQLIEALQAVKGQNEPSGV